MARLPAPGADDGVWGDVLNEFLEVTHNADGTFKSGSVTAASLSSGALTATASAAPVQSVDGQTGNVSLTASYSPQQISVVTQTDNYTLALSDATKAVEITKSTAVTLTVPLNTTAAFPVGTIIEIVQMGTGTLTIAAAPGVTLYSRDGILSLAGQYAVASIRKRATNEWIVTGDLL